MYFFDIIQRKEDYLFQNHWCRLSFSHILILSSLLIFFCTSWCCWRSFLWSFPSGNSFLLFSRFDSFSSAILHQVYFRLGAWSRTYWGSFLGNRRRSFLGRLILSRTWNIFVQQFFSFVKNWYKKADFWPFFDVKIQILNKRWFFGSFLASKFK